MQEEGPTLRGEWVKHGPLADRDGPPVQTSGQLPGCCGTGAELDADPDTSTGKREADAATNPSPAAVLPCLDAELFPGWRQSSAHPGRSCGISCLSAHWLIVARRK